MLPRVFHQETIHQLIQRINRLEGNVLKVSVGSPAMKKENTFQTT